MNTARITILAGDGIGPEIVAEGEKVLRAVGTRFNCPLHIEHHVFGGAAIDAAGEPFPPSTLAACRTSDAVLLGAVGGPRWDNVSAQRRPEAGLLALRRALELYANVRPVRSYPATEDASPLKREYLESVDLVVVRELTGGIYFGEKASYTVDGEEYARDVCTYSVQEITRVVRAAAALGRARSGKLTSVDKANVLETSRLWRRTVTRVMAEEFPDVQLEHVLVDACAMHLIKRPADFDVVVTENMFGDILTDEASVLAGSIGLLPSASLGVPNPDGRQRGVYEPIHGSAPDIAGRGIANPVGTILSVAMLLRHSLGLAEAARCVEAAVAKTLHDGVVTADVWRGSRYGTGDVGDRVVESILSGR